MAERNGTELETVTVAEKRAASLSVSVVDLPAPTAPQMTRSSPRSTTRSTRSTKHSTRPNRTGVAVLPLW